MVSAYCSVLRELSISDCEKITDLSLLELARLGPKLRYLSAAKCYQLTDLGVTAIVKHCYKLRYLNIRGCEAVSDVSLQALATNCSKLRSLDIGKCDVTDAGLEVVSRHIPALQNLSVQGCGLRPRGGVCCPALSQPPPPQHPGLPGRPQHLQDGQEVLQTVHAGRRLRG